VNPVNATAVAVLLGTVGDPALATKLFILPYFF